MNYLKFVIFLFLMLFMASCESERDIIDSNPEELKLSYSTQDFKDFQIRFDSLNQTMEESGSRISLGGAVGVAIADEAGRLAGRHVFKYLGASLCGLSGNPMLAVLGYVGGQYIGGIIGYGAASWVAAQFFSSNNSSSFNKGELMFRYDLTIETSLYYENKSLGQGIIAATKCISDSIGYYHNKVMCDLDEERIVSGGSTSLDRHKSYNDVILGFKKYNIYDENFANCEDMRLVMEDMLFKIVTISSGNDEDDLIEAYITFFSTQFENIPENDIMTFRDFTVPIITHCMGRAESEVNSYAQELNKLIKTSSLETEVKAELAIAAQTAINSALCWDQL